MSGGYYHPYVGQAPDEGREPCELDGAETVPTEDVEDFACVVYDARCRACGTTMDGDGDMFVHPPHSTCAHADSPLLATSDHVGDVHRRTPVSND